MSELSSFFIINFEISGHKSIRAKVNKCLPYSTCIHNRQDLLTELPTNHKCQSNWLFQGLLHSPIPSVVNKDNKTRTRISTVPSKENLSIPGQVSKDRLPARSILVHEFRTLSKWVVNYLLCQYESIAWQYHAPHMYDRLYIGLLMNCCQPSLGRMFVSIHIHKRFIIHGTLGHRATN